MSGASFFRPRSPWAALARTACTDCGGGDLWWGSAQDLAFLVHPSERLRVFELIGLVGSSADAWRCAACGCWGIFDGAQLG